MNRKAKILYAVTWVLLVYGVFLYFNMIFLDPDFTKKNDPLNGVIWVLLGALVTTGAGMFSIGLGYYARYWLRRP